MDDKSFLKNAMAQSFHQPLITAKEVKIARSGHHSGFIFYDTDRSKVHPAYFPLSDFYKMSKSAARTITHSTDILREYQTFKHYLSENINVPTDNEAAQKMQKDYKLSSLSRSAAQKKKVIATIISGDFAYKLGQALPAYQQILQQLTKIEQRYPDAVECCQLSEFATAYRQLINRFRFSNFAFYINKKRFLSYLCEAIQILRFQPKLQDVFLDTRRLIGENMLFITRFTQLCRGHLQYLLAILETMPQKDDLLQNAQAILANPQNYRQIIQQFRTHRAPENLAAISSLRQDAKKMFRQYAFLTYIDGVRLAFEYKLDETPEPRQPALPTVAPEEEIKKIRQLVTDSVKMTASGRFAKFYGDALKQFIQTLKETKKIVTEML